MGRSLDFGHACGRSHRVRCPWCGSTRNRVYKTEGRVQCRVCDGCARTFKANQRAGQRDASRVIMEMVSKVFGKVFLLKVDFAEPFVRAKRFQVSSIPGRSIKRNH